MKKFKDYLIITIGAMLVAVSLNFLVMPNNVAAGGVNGMAMVLNYYVPSIPVGALMVIFNVILFLLAFIVIGTSFGAKTIYASLLLSGSIWVLEKVCPVTHSLTGDVLLELIFGIILQAIGMATIFYRNASTGGTDIIAKILNKYFHINLGKGVLLADLVVVTAATLTFGFKEGLYALFVIILNGVAIDKVIEGFNACKEVRIISSKQEEIKMFILNELSRGATIYYAKGAFSESPVEVLWTIVDTKELIKIKNFIKEVDPQAFLSVSEVYETLGEGFGNMVEM
ncbi:MULTISPECIES: YitT family protein [Clostridium]|uniref:YitT family protein n=1 Tax=Clostridium cadaveris TaxID=1529 RepID=A0A1I2NH83_9CLOT|nr:YitT family protein [Clostridium cadaveris]MDU4952624.1 YitT family protein [Clostridium sp.]MDM8312826.1 YitT family protein [Clostridium cadaveris]MDY4948777.1 YitT family protein [Clostridium cadaveris]NME65600.1 YitT family protein [Clostridium cadaveris]NWK11648.1 YitT family protein [Clostridium cadaveris]